LTEAALHRAPRRHVAVAILFVIVAIARIVATYGEFNATFDEPAHLATGMQWLDKGQYNIESLHPPLARVAVALGPYLDGIRSQGHEALWREAYFVMYSGESYYRTLTLMRLGVLPFFILLCVVVWLWTRRLFGDDAAVIAVGLTTLLPPILAHGSVATTDMALTSTLLLTLYLFTRWLDTPTPGLSIALGVAGALTVLSKFSSGPYLIASAPLILAARWWLSGPSARERRLGFPAATRTVIAFATCLFVIWAGYRFSVASIGGLPMPAPEFVKGLYKVAERNGLGLDAYLLGKISTHGWWYFFPVTLAVKTPIAFLLMAVAGVVFSVRSALQTRIWHVLVPVLVVVAILASSMPANINIGVRHVLPVYPLLAIVTGGALVALWRSASNAHAKRAFVGVAAAWLLIASARAHPDYIADFNELVGNRPDRVLVNGDLDWGQDLDRLAEDVRKRGITRIRIAYFGSASPPKHIPGVERLAPHDRSPGWVAVSEAVIKGVLVAPRDGYAWADSIAPVARIGKSIRLYHFK
jgi:hypothetical protein